MNNLEKKELITSWLASKERLALIQAEERDMRAKLINEFFGENPGSGTRNAGFADFKIKGTFGIDYKFDEKGLLEAIEAGDISSEAQDAIRVKYEVDVKIYKKLDDETSAELDDYIITKPSMPQLAISLVEQKDEE